MNEFEKAEGYYDRIRERVRAEDILYNQRIIWLISMQAFLFATLGLVLQSFLSDGIDRHGTLLTASFILIEVTGILVAMVSNRVISNGRIALNSLRDQWNEFDQGLSEETRKLFPHPRGKHEEGDRLNIWTRGISSGNLPLIFIWVWLAFLLFLALEIFGVQMFP